MNLIALSLRHLNKIYKNGTIALKNLNLEVKQGDFFALLGPNGAGKSTTIGIITSLVQKTSGDVYIFNYNLDTHPSHSKALLGVVPQEYNFHVFSKIWDVLIFQAGFYGVPSKIAQRRAEYFLKRLDLWEKRHFIVNALSGGQKRRLMIARALMNEPKLLILDEPTAGVDIELRHALWGFLKELNAQGTTIILTTHYLEEAEQLCNHLAIINHGIIIENSPITESLKRLKRETFILFLKEPLQQLPPSDFCLRLMDTHTLEVDVMDGQHLDQLFFELSQHQIAIASLRNKTSRLEQLFLNLTRTADESV